MHLNSYSTLIQQVRKQVSSWCLQHQDTRKVFHDEALSFFLATTVDALGQASQSDERDIATAHLAALIYPVALRVDAAQPLLTARQLVQQSVIGTTEEATRVVACLGKYSNKTLLMYPRIY
ncbi:MAG: hypothetical protein R2795_08620 [Saprospiraceae bacterium]